MNLSGSPFDFVLAFFGGILASLTPCLYPLIPVSAGYIGIASSGSRLKGFTLSFIYVSGIALVYALLGLLASLTGTIFGALTTHPLTYIIVGIIIVFFGLAGLDIIRLPGLAILKAAPSDKKGYLPAFLLGLASGLLISPCLTPILGAILTYLVTKKHLLYGTLLLLCFAYGMGLIIMLAGLFGSLLVNLPRAGKWMSYLKKFFAAVIIVTGAYFIYAGLRGL